jgi:hypothetical protein
MIDLVETKTLPSNYEAMDIITRYSTPGVGEMWKNEIGGKRETDLHISLMGSMPFTVMSRGCRTANPRRRQRGL